MKREFVVSSGLELEKVGELIMKDIERRVDEACIEIVNQAAFSCERHATWLTPRRLPSMGGGSYGQRHHMGVSPGFTEHVWNRSRDAYNDHEWAQAIDNGTKRHEIKAKTPMGMRIEKVLPVRGGGQKAPQTPPYGTKYVRTRKGARKGSAIAMYVVDHPGGRPFRIYHDTWKRQCGLMVKLMKKVLRDKMK